MKPEFYSDGDNSTKRVNKMTNSNRNLRKKLTGDISDGVKCYYEMKALNTGTKKSPKH